MVGQSTTIPTTKGIRDRLKGYGQKEDITYRKLVSNKEKMSEE